MPEEKFQKYVVLWGYLIPCGVFNQPNKWVNTYTINPLDTYVLVPEFKPEEYEYGVCVAMEPKLRLSISGHKMGISND
ncbi:hypothetical protein [Bacillus sp. MMSF_3353]|uniref:hypothetical protein n=1 Tax=Bacillus sp. MMSF_3353 TaxID=3047081 RepID=UPI00273DDDA5|nr:hypothetical protein [Bacillus sp. MMSF_3353]